VTISAAGRQQIEDECSRIHLVALLEHVRTHFVSRPGVPLTIERSWEVAEPDGSRDMWLQLNTGHCTRVTVLPPAGSEREAAFDSFRVNLAETCRSGLNGN
jgi:hypothetical protein